MNPEAPTRWFRLYAEFLTDPKVQMLAEKDQRRFIMVLCLRCSNGNVTLHDDEVAFQLRISSDDWRESKAVLLAKNLISGNNQPVAWNKRQYVSDSSRERVSKHREKLKKGCNVTVTPPETETETEYKVPKGTLSSLLLDQQPSNKSPSEEATTRQRDKIPFSEIVAALNEKAGTSFKANNKVTVRHIKARWNEGFRGEDFKAVIEHKCTEWMTDEKMVQFLRPQTLFSTKFESYLQVARSNCGGNSAGKTRCERCSYNKIEKCRNLSKENFDPSKCGAFVPG